MSVWRLLRLREKWSSHRVSVGYAALPRHVPQVQDMITRALRGGSQGKSMLPLIRLKVRPIHLFASPHSLAATQHAVRPSLEAAAQDCAVCGRRPSFAASCAQVDYTGFTTINAQRFGQKFVGKVANPHDMLTWTKALSKRCGLTTPLPLFATAPSHARSTSDSRVGPPAATWRAPRCARRRCCPLALVLRAARACGALRRCAAVPVPVRRAKAEGDGASRVDADLLRPEALDQVRAPPHAPSDNAASPVQALARCA